MVTVSDIVFAIRPLILDHAAPANAHYLVKNGGRLVVGL